LGQEHSKQVTTRTAMPSKPPAPVTEPGGARIRDLPIQGAASAEIGWGRLCQMAASARPVLCVEADGGSACQDELVERR
jgi:hypothetical protein